MRQSSHKALTRYRATVEYDGTDFYGFQRQVATQRTIQGELETALSKLAQANIQIIGAGRTDAGVHARGQVIAFELAQWRHGNVALQKGINALLPRSIAVRDVGVSSAEFHPRFDAKRRGYRYTILNAPVRSPLVEQRAWHLYGPLDVDAMNAAAAHLVGQHDFATFGTPPQGNNTVRDLFKAQWQTNGQYLYFDVEATAFLKRMVRSLVGSLRLVGGGTWSVEDFVTALKARDRSRSGPSAPPQGLVLEFVSYDD